MQRKKAVDTLSEDNLKKFEIDVLSRNDREKDKERKENSLLIFSQLFVQVIKNSLRFVCFQE
jgi:hypothetical protein